MKQPFVRPVLATAVLCLFAACSGKAPDTSTVSQSLSLPPEAGAASTDASNPGAANDTAAASGAAGAVAAPASSTPIPSATDDIWKALDKQGYALQKAVDGASWKDAQAAADAIRDLTAALPAHASNLSSGQQNQLQQQVTLIATYAGKLDAAAQAGNANDARDNYKRLNDTLGGIVRFP
ncbi:MAG: hypothetical protein JSR26_05370 [Proteobacteria bacterium]|nr:hypothetical protein [Pseudomonadota bacterium]